MSEATAAVPSPARRGRLRFWIDILATAACALLFARLIYLPQARPLGKDDALTAPAGQWLVLDGMPAGAVLNLAVEVPGEVKLSAPSATIDPASRTYLRSIGVPTAPVPGPVQWGASATGSRATLIADLSVLRPGARFALSVVPGGGGVRLRVERGALMVSLRLDSDAPARGLLDAPGSGGPQAYGPGRPVAFVLTPGAAGAPEPLLAFAIAGRVSLRLIAGDGSEEPPGLTDLEVEADRVVQTRTCGGAVGRIEVAPALFQPRATPIPALSMCAPGRMTLGALALQPDAAVAQPSGTAYVSGQLPLWARLKDNPAIGALLLAIVGYPAARLLGLLRQLSATARNTPRS